MDFIFILLIVVFIFIVILSISGIRIVQQSTVVIVERLGRYHKTLESGINLIIPFLDKVRSMKKRYVTTDFSGRQVIKFMDNPVIDMRERVYDFPKQTVITNDNVTIEINAMVYFQITDPFKAMYEIEDLGAAIENLTQTTLRNVIGGMELDQTLTSRDTVNTKLRVILDEATDKWGVKINRVELQDITPPKDIREAMEKQMRAEREKREMILRAEGERAAKILAAEGERDSLIFQAEGRKQSQILDATGEAEAIFKVAEAEAKSIEKIQANLQAAGMDATQYLIAMKYVEALKEIASQNGEKVIFLPYESSALMGSISSIKEIFTNS